MRSVRAAHFVWYITMIIYWKLVHVFAVFCLPESTAQVLSQLIDTERRKGFTVNSDNIVLSEGQHQVTTYIQNDSLYYLCLYWKCTLFSSIFAFCGFRFRYVLKCTWNPQLFIKTRYYFCRWWSFISVCLKSVLWQL